MKTYTENELDDLQGSTEYAEYIMEHCRGDRVIANGDMLTEAMEDGYLFAEFIFADFIDSLEK